MSALILTAAFVSLAIGAGVLWANPHRFVNRAFVLSALASAGWLTCVFVAAYQGARYVPGSDFNPVPWLRGGSIVGAFFPWIIWLMKESILVEAAFQRQALRRSWPWFAIGCGLAVLASTDFFIPRGSTPDNPSRGLGYLVYNAISVPLYVVLIFDAFRQLRTQTGIRRIEMQFLTFNAGVACLAAILINAWGSYLDMRALARLSPLTILIFYALTAWAVTFHRVFDAEQVFVALGQRVALIVALCAGVLGLAQALQPILPSPFDLLLSLTVCGPAAFWLDRNSRDWLRISPAQHVATLRRAATEFARSQPSPDKLVMDFEELLRAHYHASFAHLLFDGGEAYAGAGASLALPKSRSGYQALCKAGWATPESLQRQRAAPGLVDLRQLMTEHDLGLLVTAPRGHPEPTLVAALGVKTNKRPFTYPEVQQLQEIAEFMDNVLARSRLTLQARQSEQLAVIGLVGASLAHEIRNPLVSIKTFAHLLPTRFEDPAFRQRFNQLIPTEVDRIDSLTQQLLDLAHPRSHILERVSLHGIVRDTLDLMQTNATEAKVAITPRLGANPDVIHADGSAIRQVLINLLINSIQALEAQPDNRAIEIFTRSLSNGGVILDVSDNGPGIPAEQRSRLFHPFASTKTKGMGLGLAICADILREHNATINVPELGRPGATFRITFPCPPP
ncbi:MAG TPA: ATP-binding protein [Opitutaceae bacterium]|nr:ATP-binding protein [Opitutaceae bacterium]